MFSNKEAGAYIGNTGEVNQKHYEMVDPNLLSLKIRQVSLSKMMDLGDFDQPEGRILN